MQRGDAPENPIPPREQARKKASKTTSTGNDAPGEQPSSLKQAKATGEQGQENHETRMQTTSDSDPDRRDDDSDDADDSDYAPDDESSSGETDEDYESDHDAEEQSDSEDEDRRPGVVRETKPEGGN
ncbi:hypothetical protein BU23DRAFT_550156, partial [Bimuria novae-zelandiae CBS 107.79]